MIVLLLLIRDVVRQTFLPWYSTCLTSMAFDNTTNIIIPRLAVYSSLRKEKTIKITSYISWQGITEVMSHKDHLLAVFPCCSYSNSLNRVLCLVFSTEKAE